LMEERAAAAKKIAEEEKKILELQKAQQKLQLLEAQFKLLDLIREYKLNAKSILGDIKLGSNVDPSQLVDATTRALESIVGKLDSQISNGKLGGGGGGGGGGGLNWKRQLGIPEGSKDWEDALGQTKSEFLDKHPKYRNSAGIGAAHGLSMVVPPGYPNDTFGPIWATSGEAINIGAPRQSSGQVVNVNVSISVPAIDNRLTLEEVAFKVANVVKKKLR
jgi:hypothetical protein